MKFCCHTVCFVYEVGYLRAESYYMSIVIHPLSFLTFTRLQSLMVGRKNYECTMVPRRTDVRVRSDQLTDGHFVYQLPDNQLVD